MINYSKLQHPREILATTRKALETKEQKPRARGARGATNAAPMEAQMGLLSWLFPSNIELSASVFFGWSAEDLMALGALLHLLNKAENWKDALATILCAKAITAKFDLPGIMVRVSEGLQAQSGAPTKPWIASALTLVIAYALAGSKGIPLIASSGFWQKPAWRDIASVSTLVGPLFAPLLAWTFEAITGAPYLTPELVAHETKIQSLLDKVDAMDAVGLQDRLHTNPLLCDKVLELESQLFELMKLAPPNSFNRDAPAAVSLARGKIHRWTSWVEAAGRGRGAPRTPPLVIRLWGASGVGKSALGPLLAANILRGHYEPAPGTDVSSLFYTRVVGSKHWNGYTQQPVVFYDDFGQQTDSASSPNMDFYELIQVANSSPLNVEMADLERKARTFFTSPLVILSSNRQNYNVPSVTHAPAVWRRIELDVEVRVNRRPSPLCPPGHIDTSVYSFHVGTYGRHYREGDRRDIQILNWDELCALSRIRFGSRTDVDNARRSQINEAFAPVEAQADFTSGDVPPDTFTYRTLDLLEPDEYEAMLQELPYGATVEEVAVIRRPDTPNCQRLAIVRSPTQLEVDTTGPLRWLVPLDANRSPLQRAYTRLCETWRSTKGWLGAWVRRITGLSLWQRLALATAAAAAAKLALRAATPWSNQEIESIHERAPAKPVVHRSGLFSPRSGLTQQHAEMAMDPVARSLSPKLRANIRYITTANGAVLGYLFGVCDRFAIMPLHIYHGALVREVYVSGPGGQRQLDFSQLGGFAAESDLAVVRLPDNWPPFKDVRKHFVHESELTITQFQARLLFPDVEKMGTALIAHHKESYMDPTTRQRVTLSRHVRYHGLETDKGDCGAILTHCNPGLPRKIVGYHVAGSAEASCARVLTREELEAILAKLGGELDAESGDSTLDLDFERVGTDKPYVFPKNSKIRPSPLHRAFPPTKGRAILRSIGGFDPLIEGVNRYAKARRVDKSEWEPALDIAETLLLYPIDPPLARVLTTEESLERWENLEPVHMNKSSGHPWARDPRGTKKQVWLEPLDPRVQGAIEDLIERAVRGDPPTEVFVDCLKDEKRSLARCDPSQPQNIKTRVFSIAPLEHLVAMRRFFGAFVSHTIKHRVSNTLTAGIVPQSAEWDKLARHMESVGHQCYDGDWAGFDTTLPASLIEAFGVLAERWYKRYDRDWSERDAAVRAYLMRSTANSLHHVDGQIIRWHGGLPSGCFGTNQIDSVSNLLIFIRAAQEAGLGGGEILSSVRMVFHGDDNLFSVHHDIAHRFTPQHVADYGASIGMKFTAADKSPPGDYKPLSQCSFLKRGFLEDAGLYLAPLDLDSIREMVRWTQAPHGDTESFPAVLDMAFVELVLHVGSAESRQTAETLYAAARDAGFTPHRPSLDEVKLQFFTGLRLERGFKQVGAVEDMLSLQPNRNGKMTYKPTDTPKTRTGQRLAAQMGDTDAHTAGQNSSAGVNSLARAPAAVPGHNYPMIYGSSFRPSGYSQSAIHRRPTGNRAKRDTGYLSVNAPGGYIGGKPHQGFKSEKAAGNTGLAAVPEVPDVTGDTQIETVTYIDQVPQQVGDDPYVLRSQREVFALEREEHTIQDIIGRPRPREQFMWIQGQDIGTNLWTLNLPRALFLAPQTGAEMPAVTAKTNQFQYMRATVNVRIALNAMQFHQGRLLLTFNPLETMRGARASNTSTTYETGLKSLQIDPNKHQSVVLSIPLVAPYSHWNLPGAHLDLGVVRLTVLQPLFSAIASQSVTITPTIYLTDIELSMPTPADSALVAQMGDDEGKPAEEAAAQKDGVISGPLATISRVAGGVASLTGGMFPTISALSESTAWVTSFLSGAARYFGYNKPSSYAGARAYFDTTAYPYHLMDGAAQAVKLGAAQDHDLPVVPGLFGTDVDEMHISYIVSKPNIVQTFSWAQADPVGTLVMSPFVFPGACNEFATAGNSISFQSTHTAFVASMFRYWHGTMKYRIALVSTGFHAGRLLISYVPNARAGIPQVLDEFGNAWSMVWDISERNDIEFSIPWCSNMPALQTHLDDVNMSYLLQGTQPEDSGPYGTAEQGEFLAQLCNGRFTVTVLSQLVNPDTTRNIVDLQLFISGGPDLEFFQPEVGSYIPTTQDLNDPLASGMFNFVPPVFSAGARAPPVRERVAPAMEYRPLSRVSDDWPPPPEDSVKWDVSLDEEGHLEAQGAFYQGDPAYPDQSILGRERNANEPMFTMTEVPQTYAAALVAGEKITSLRQLIKRHSTLARFTTLIPEDSVMVIDPNHFRIGDANEDSATLRNRPMALLDYISSIYAAYRGSQRLAFHVARRQGGEELTSLGLVISRLSGVATNRGPGRPSSFSLGLPLEQINARTATLILSRSDRDVELDIPYVARTPLLPVRNRGATIAHNDSSAIFDESAPVLLQLAGPTSNRARVIVTRAASDDFSFGLLVGAPVLRKVQYTLHSSTANGQTTIFR